MLEIRHYIEAFLSFLRVIPVGRPDDGVDSPLFSSGSEIDKNWPELLAEINDSREAWRKNPMARRIIGLTTSYVVGAGISASSDDDALKKFIEEFWEHPQNRFSLRLDDWSDELARAGELFVALFVNPQSAMSYVRLVPASRIEEIRWRDGDYESELAYRETSEVGRADRWWISPLYAEAAARGERPQEAAAHDPIPASDEDPAHRPWMLHYAVNRPVGALRGESDLAPVLPWLRRYNRWLEDRVRLNAAVRAFVWIVTAPRRAVSDLKERYKRPPDPGSVIVAEDNEEWKAVAPNLQARDASADGRAIRWMIAAGGPGTSLVDFGEGEDSNLATAQASSEQRRRFLLRRQAYFAWMLADITASAFNRYRQASGQAATTVTAADVLIIKPDISTEDNAAVAKAATDLVKALLDLRKLLGDSQALRRFGLRLFVRYAGESITEQEFERLLESGL